MKYQKDFAIKIPFLLDMISICLPTLNARRFLEARMESILSQTETNWELIVCDSYSTDGTWEFLQHFANDPRIHLHQVPKEGLYAGWNECLKRCQGDYIYIATADDTADRNLLSTLTNHLDMHPQVEVAACLCKSIDEFDQILNIKPTIYDQIIQILGKGNIIQTDSKIEISLILMCGHSWGSVTRLLFRKTLFDAVGHFPTQFGDYGDWAWTLKAAARTGVLHIPQRLATWRIHSAQASSNWSLTGSKVYHQMLAEFIQTTAKSFRIFHQWDKTVIDHLLHLAWLRYESDADWFLLYMVTRPFYFFQRAYKISRLDKNLLFRRLLHKLGPANVDHLYDPKLALNILQKIDIGPQNIIIHEVLTPENRSSLNTID